MTDDETEASAEFVAHRCPNGHLTYPGHGRCPDCGREQAETVDLSDRTAEVLTWTTSTATPSGVREPNTLAIVAFEIEGQTVRALGSTTGEVAIGDTVEPVYVQQLRDPEESLRAEESQSWSGYRFEPVA